MNATARRTDLQVVKPAQFDPNQAPPHDEALEKALLAAILTDGRVVDLVADQVTADEFYDRPRGTIFGSMLQMRAAGTAISIPSVVSWLNDRGILNQVGGPGAIARLKTETPVLGHVVEYARKVALKAKRRAVIAKCQAIAAEGFGDVGDEAEWIDLSTKQIRRLADNLKQSNAISLRQSLEIVFRKMHTIAAGQSAITGYSTGLKQLDELVAGWHGGEVTLLGGETGRGKTAFACCQAVNVASKPQVEVVQLDSGPVDVTVPIGVVFFSLEMPHEDLTSRFCCNIGRVDYNRIRTGNWDHSDINAFIAAGNTLERLPIIFDDTDDVSMANFEARLARIEAQLAAIGVRVGLVIIDYIQLMDVKNEADKNANREQQFNFAGRRLKNFAKRFRARPKALPIVDGRVIDAGQLEPSKVAFCVLTQLNDDGQVRESKALLQHAHNFWLLESSEDQPEGPGQTTRGKIRVKKQRNGPRNKVAECWWHASYTLYSDEER